MPVLLGLDCGGSSTRALAVDDGGTVLHQGQAGSANLSSTNEKKIRMSLQAATKGSPQPQFVCGCFAGLLTAEDRARSSRYLEELFPHACVRVEPDYAAALYASEPETDICVIAGTGSLVCSAYDGKLVKSGGRGYLLGDYGSGYIYGRDAVIAYLDQKDQASPSLRQMIRKVFGVEDEHGVVSKLYHMASPPATLAKMAKAIALDAADNQGYAVESLKIQSGRLARVIVEHAQAYLQGRPSLCLSLAGGLWQSGGVFRESLMDQLKELMPDVEFQSYRIKHPPVYGAVQLAREMIDGN